MNREILFRGKRIDNGEWVYGYYLVQNGRGVDWAKDAKIHQIYDLGGTQNVIPESVGQFTGIFDKKGKRVFEGDITNNKNWNPENYQVIFDQGEFCFTTEELKPYTNALHYLQDFEVIGNIHDNPELLER